MVHFFSEITFNNQASLQHALQRVRKRERERERERKREKERERDHSFLNTKSSNMKLFS